MDDLTFSAKRASAATPVPDLDARFRSLVQSPLRAGILRYLSARPDESFGVEELMQTFGRMRLDVDNCVRELVAFGICKKTAPAGGGAPKYGFVQPDNAVLHDLLLAGGFRRISLWRV